MSKQANISSPYTILAFCFADQARAGEVMKELKAGKTLEEHRVVAAAVVEVDEYGKAQIQQHGRGGVGAAVGITAGEALALIGGPAGLNKAVLPHLEEVLDYEAHIQDIAGRGEEHKEGVRAFLEKRPASYYPL